MKIVLVLNFNDLQRLSDLFARLYERFPHGWVFFEEHNEQISPVLSVPDHSLSHDDRNFFDILKPPYITRPSEKKYLGLIYSWYEVKQ